MRVVSAAVFSAAVLVAAVAAAPFPVAKTVDGFQLGSKDGPIFIDLFYDLQCPNCRDNWPIMKEVLKQHGDKVQLRIHHFPLPYHRNAFHLHQALQIIHGLKGPSSTVPFLDLIFDNQDQWYGSQWADKSDIEVVAAMADRIGAKFSVAHDEFVKLMASVPTSDIPVRFSWKFGAFHGVCGTPTIHANNVYLEDAGNWNAKDWHSFIAQRAAVLEADDSAASFALEYQLESQRLGQS